MSRFRVVALAVGAFIGAVTLPTASAHSTVDDVGMAAERAFAEALRLEATPRAQILAANSVAIAAADRDALIARASASADADAFVQWFAASYAHDDEASADALRALQSLEPGNGMVWLLTLGTATQAGNAQGVSAAVTRMATATRFDDRSGELVVEWLRAGDRHPRHLRDVVNAQAGGDRAAAPIVRAIAHASALAIPAGQSLLSACRAGADGTRVVSLDECSAVGRLLAGESNTLVSRAMGIALLRITDDPLLADQERRFAWLNESALRLPDVAADPAHARRLEADWREVGHEIGVLERQLARLGLPLEPPADWQPAARSVAAGGGDPPR